MKKLIVTLTLLLMAMSLPTLSSATLIFSDPSGLGARAEFTLNPLGDELTIVLTNTSTGIPSGFSNSDALLTSLSFDLGPSSISGGIANMTSGSAAISFSGLSSDPHTGPLDVSPEWGYGNTGATGLLDNFVSTNESHATKFSIGNLDGPDVLSGPQGGLSNYNYDLAFLPSLNPLGRINDSVTFWLDLEDPISDLGFLQNGAIVEFGSDAAFLRPSAVPEPAVMLLLGGGLICFAVVGRRKFFKK